MPNLSIITINKNNASGLEKTIKSVIDQTYRDFEYIIIDGKSEDNSVSIINSFNDYIDFWVSETDTGIYNAMNKGIKVAEGNYCLFLNSGDYLFNCDVLQNLFNNIINEDIITGYVLSVSNEIKMEIYPPELFTFRYFYFHNIPHQAELIKRSLFNIIGLYNESFQILSDYEFNIKALIHNVSFKFINICVSIVDINGISNYSLSSATINYERKRIFETCLPNGIIQDYNYWLDSKTYSHKSIVWLVNNSLFFRIIKFIHKYFYCGSK